jgi:hypothetical protein
MVGATFTGLASIAAHATRLLHIAERTNDGANGPPLLPPALQDVPEAVMTGAGLLLLTWGLVRVARSLSKSTAGVAASGVVLSLASLVTDAFLSYGLLLGAYGDDDSLFYGLAVLHGVAAIGAAVLARHVYVLARAASVPPPIPPAIARLQ